MTGRLAGRGFEEIEPTFGMVAELADLPADEIAAEHAVRVAPRKVDPRWVRAAASAYGGDKSDDFILIEIVAASARRRPS